MPEINIEEKIQEALKKKSFKENKKEYLGLALVYCVMLFITFAIGYFVPLLSILVFFLMDIPLMMGFKHFIWFGPASGETLIDGFKVSMICGYLNYFSYIKIFFASNIRPVLFALLSVFVATSVGTVILESIYSSDIKAILEAGGTSENIIEGLFANESIKKGIGIISTASLAFGALVFYLAKLNRSLLPYVSFLRLTSLEGKSMEGVIAHTRRILKAHRWSYYLKATMYHLFYLIPMGASVGIYALMSLNPVYSIVTLELISVLAFFITMFPAVLFVELNNRNFCIEANQAFIQEHKKMLNDAMNDLNDNVKR